MANIFAFLRDGRYLTTERLALIPAALLAGYALALVMLFATAHGSMDYRGRPLGTDFSNVYAAGTAVNAGHACLPFDPPSQYREEQRLFGHATPFYGWHYPPYFLLVGAPLARLPYLAALAVWQLGTLALFLGAIAALLRVSDRPSTVDDPRWLLLALAFPAVFVNLTHGNNGFLTAALLAAGLATLDRRPLAAGMLFGLLAYKPQFAVVLPVALAFGGYWRTIASALATVAILTLVVTLLFGTEVWSAFMASTAFARSVVLEEGNTGFNKMQSVFAWTRLWGGSVGLAYALQTVTSLAAVTAVAVLWRNRAPFAERGALLAIAALLATPYSLDYDLVALAPAIALLAAQGLAKGFRVYEISLLAALWTVPIVAREVAGATLIPIGPALLLIAAVYVVRLQGRTVSDLPPIATGSGAR